MIVLPLMSWAGWTLSNNVASPHSLFQVWGEYTAVWRQFLGSFSFGRFVYCIHYLGRWIKFPTDPNWAKPTSPARYLSSHNNTSGITFTYDTIVCFFTDYFQRRLTRHSTSTQYYTKQVLGNQTKVLESLQLWQNGKRELFWRICLFRNIFRASDRWYPKEHPILILGLSHQFRHPFVLLQ